MFYNQAVSGFVNEKVSFHIAGAPSGTRLQ